ncbi:ROK family protein [Mesorhizobium sp. M4A.F.Ca.ET.050.02.1.1]|uniref:ROK family protein n=1 Tax=Mesorhizobium sp. M4A.F.Ca.ET.050.02.1.1 TaxID=2496754 RepID=UPI000FC9B822|nr:ROK family protein [Mesorhizobium sp. M4A.F.Ca.ET.050.02.1.1]RUX46041.1 ROK family protein [Mesorhizobium sp. M4A.F.Ca.ET.050.02.1.1]
MQPEASPLTIAAAIDFGGTKLAVGFIDTTGRVLASTQFATPEGGPAEVAMSATNALRALSRRVGLNLDSLAGIGATVPGLADRATGVLRFAPTQGWRDVPFAAMLSEAVGLPVSIENDVNVCAIAEQRFGVARNCSNYLWITVSTGIGGALVLNGRLFEGPRSLAGEIGHMAVAVPGPRCGCGHTGCLQAVASGTAIREAAIKRGLDVTGAREVFELASNGDTRAVEIVDAVHFHIGLALSHAINLLDLDMIVIGGGVADSLDITKLATEVLAHVITLPEHTPAVVRTTLRSEAALIGAGLLAFSRREDFR